MIPSIREAIVEERGEQLRREARVARLANESLGARKRSRPQVRARVLAPVRWRHLPSLG